MAELSSRMQKTASAILPKIAATIAERTSDVRKIDLATAENWLLRPEIIEICKASIQESLTEAELSYPAGFGGDPKLQEALVAFFNKYFDPRVPVETQDITVTPGASSCLDSLLFSLCEAGDSVLVLAPYWSGFDFHLVLRPNVNIIPVYTDAVCLMDEPEDMLSESLVPALERAIESCGDKARVKAFVITNPHNPIARCYPKHILQEAIHWCAEHGIHYISDEVYAISDFSCVATPAEVDGATIPDPDGDRRKVNGSNEHRSTPFISALALELEVHQSSSISVVWSTSKDLGSSGFRMGVHVSRRHHSSTLPNGGPRDAPDTSAGPSLLTTSLGLLSATQLPTLSMLITHALLTSGSFDTLVQQNRRRLREHHDIITHRLRKWGVPFVPATSGPYLLAYLGVKVGDVQRLNRPKHKPESSDESQQKDMTKRRRVAFLREHDGEDVIDVLRHKAKVLVSPGKTFHMRSKSTGPEPLEGWARITFAVPADVLHDALDRIGNVLALDSLEAGE